MNAYADGDASARVQVRSQGAPRSRGVAATSAVVARAAGARAAPLPALALALVLGGGAADAAAPTYSVQQVVEFEPGTRQALSPWSSLPDVQEIVGAGAFGVAAIDFDDDGTTERVVQSAAASLCGNGGCLTLVLGRSQGKPTLLLAMNLNSPFAVTREKPNGYRALAALDARQAIASGDRPGTPLYRKPLVYPMTVAAKAPGAAAASAAVVPAAKPGNVCAGVAWCSENASLAVVVTQVRASELPGFATRYVALTIGFRNKSARPLVLGYDKRSALVVDDAGNRYGIHGARGMPDVAQGRDVDTSFVVQPGEAAEARFEFSWQGHTLAGTAYELDLSVREIELLPGNQVRFGREHAIGIRGLRAGKVERAAGSSGGLALGAGAGAGATPTDAAPVGDPCNGSGACFAGGSFVAEVARVITSQPSNGPVNAERVVRFEVRFRNATNGPLILAHDPFSTVVIDDNGNRYGYWNQAINIAGIGQIRGSQIDTSFALRPGESRSATFEVRFVYDSRKSVPADVYSFDLAVQEVEELPSRQLRVLREHAIGFQDLSARTRAPGTGGTQPNVQGAKELVEGLKNLFKKKP